MFWDLVIHLFIFQIGLAKVMKRTMNLFIFLPISIPKNPKSRLMFWDLVIHLFIFQIGLTKEL
jgi:hypothetical protein